MKSSKTILGVLLAAIAAGTFAAAGSAGGTTPSPRSGALHVTKECPEYHGLAGEHCTIRWSNLNQIMGGSNVVYAQAANFGTGVLDSDLVIDGPGNNTAYGHVALNHVTHSGSITFSGGTGVFSGFHASATVTATDVGLPTEQWHWDGTYSFTPPGHDE
jgi:hypothetical protein